MKEYIEKPYIISKDELTSMPAEDVLDLIKHITQATKQQAQDAHVHCQNILNVKNFLNQMVEKPH